MFCSVKIIRIVKYMNSLMSCLMSFLKLQKIQTSFLVISRLSLGLPVLRLFSADWWDLNQSVTYFSGENWSMGPLIFINRIQLVISMDSLSLKSVHTIFIAEKPLSSSDVDMGIIFNKLINITKSAGIDWPSLSKYTLKRLR